MWAMRYIFSSMKPSKKPFKKPCAASAMLEQEGAEISAWSLVASRAGSVRGCRVAAGVKSQYVIVGKDLPEISRTGPQVHRVRKCAHSHDSGDCIGALSSDILCCGSGVEAKS